MIENGATDARYFYFGKIISTVLQTAYAASQILKIISKLGPELVKLSTAFSGGTTVKIVGEVAAVANDAGMSAEEAETLTGMLGWAAAGVVFTFGTVVGADNAAKLVKAFKEGDSGSSELENVYNSIKESPNYPEGFEPRRNGTTRNTVKNKGLLEKLREIESGTWKKVYKDGYDINGNEISIHYFQSESGKVFDVKVKPGWSN